MAESQPTYDQINDQLANGVAPSVLVERSANSDSEDKVVVGQIITQGEEKTRVFYGNLNDESQSQDAFPASRFVSNEALTDEHQQKLAAELAGVALREGVPAWSQQQGNNLTEREGRAIQESVDKNIALTRMYGSTYFNTPPKK